MYQTDCKSCIFNVYSHRRPIKGFVDCQQHRYDKFKKLGVVSEDGYTINRLCTACRDENWGKRFEGKEDEQLFKELTEVYTLMIVDENPDTKVLERLQKSLENEQTIRPRQIVFGYTADVEMKPINDFLRSFIKDKNIEFIITRIFEQDYEREIIDVLAKHVKGMFYLVQRNGQVLRPNSFELIYKYLEVELLKTLVIHNKDTNDYHNLAASILYHKRLNGNLSTLLETKAYQDEEKWVISTWPILESICNNV